MRRMAPAVFGMFAATFYGAAADLTVAITARDDGITYEAVVSLQAPGKAVTGLQFDVAWDPDLIGIQSVEASDAVTTQDKQAATSEPDRGLMRVLVIGMNAFPLLNQDLIRITFVVQNAVTDGVRPVRLQQAMGVTGDGDSISVSTEEDDPNIGSSRSEPPSLRNRQHRAPIRKHAGLPALTNHAAGSRYRIGVGEGAPE